MQKSLLAIAILATGCAEQSSFGTKAVTRAPIACNAEAVLNEGRQARVYPTHCPEDAALLNRYNLGYRIAALEEENAKSII